MKFPLMRNNLLREDLDAVIEHLKQDDPILTHGANVRAFEAEWSQWLGVKYSVFVNSGASANLLTMAILRILHPQGGEVIVPPLAWVSDVAAVLQNGFEPVFADIDPRTLAMDPAQILAKVNDKTRAVFLTHVQGFDGLTDDLLEELNRRNIPLIEDVCESHGATHNGRKLGSFGWISNFSFYYAHHMSTIEGGMVCTDDPDEPDDSYSSARRIDDALPHMKANNQICAMDDDWYRVNLFAGETVYATIAFTQTTAAEDLDLHLYRGTTDLTPCSESAPGTCSAANGQGSNSNENMSYTVSTAGYYYVVVHGWNGAQNGYNICIGLSSTACPPLP